MTHCLADKKILKFNTCWKTLATTSKLGFLAQL